MSFFEQLDVNRDGTVDKGEFIDGVMRMQILTMTEEKAEDAYKLIDHDGNNSLSLGEIWFFIEGA
jgi:Ca2+-binding EF-hand superfamily protein